MMPQINLLRSLQVGALALAAIATPAHAKDGSLSLKDRAALLAKGHITCDSTDDACTAGDLATGDFYDVRIYGDCGTNPYYGRIGNKSVAARDKVSTTGNNPRTTAELPADQMVCILASASAGRGKSDAEFYVMAMPWDYDPSCAGDKRCRKPIPKPKSEAMLACKTDIAGKRYTNCPEGWVFANDMEAYPMGLPGQR